MENRFEHTPPEEQQGWGAYATPPPIPGTHNSSQSELPQGASLCARVREMLPHLLEDDGEVRPEMARQVYAHLSVCPGCAAGFEDMQRVVTLLETLTAPEMPGDLATMIMRRIEAEGPAYRDVAQRQSLHDPRAVPGAQSGTPSMSARATRPALGQEAVTAGDARLHITQTQSSQTQTGSKSTLTSVQTVLTRTASLQRLTAAAVLTAILAFFVSNPWGRQALGTNLSGVRSWLDQMGGALGRIPLLGKLTAYIFGALTQLADSLGDTYRNVGATAAKGLALDVALCAAAYFFLASRRQNDQMRSL